VTNREKQGFWEPGKSTLRLPPAMRLANADRERLWKGLERFVNCKDDLSDFQALGRAFPGFWPVGISYRPDSNMVVPLPLRWHRACHSLFLCYRDALQDVWKGDTELSGQPATFLLGLTELNTTAFEAAKSDTLEAVKSIPFIFNSLLADLRSAWRQILAQVPTAAPAGHFSLGMLWDHGEFCLRLEGVGGVDFPNAFYMLFRQSWRARVCPRCKLFFVARGTKQKFCGTGCSAGSRNASKLKWWRRVGGKRRARHRETSRKWEGRGRKRR
jgi:hypothetical protein